MATSYLALLRGINVGGKNLVPMADLRAAVEAAGFRRVETYIQSGNVVFEGSGTRAVVESRLEDALRAAFGFAVLVVVRTHRELHAVVHDAPKGFGAQPAVHHSDVVFLKSPLTSTQAMRVVQTRDGVDRAWPGKGVVYFERLSARRTSSRMSRIAGTPEYKSMTIRNWATTTKMLALLDARAG